MLVYSFYVEDNRVKRYAETLVKKGFDVDVISLRRENQQFRARVNGVNVYRIQKRVKNEKAKLSYLLKLLLFFFNSLFFLTFKYLKSHYKIIHVHSIPDFEVFAAIVPKLLGAKIILDIHDIVPEFYASKFGATNSSFLYKSLLLCEKVAIAFSHHVIISNNLWREKLISRSVRPEKCTSILNYPDRNLFFKSTEKKENDKLVFLYPGTLNYHQGLDIAIEAFNKVREQAGNSEFHIYGEGPAKESLIRLVEKNGLQDRVLLKNPVSLDEIAKVMALADIGVIPKRNDFFAGEAFSTKSLEFMSLGIPIIVSRTKIDQYYFNDSVVKFFQPENPNDLAEAMIAMARDKSMRRKQATLALKFVENNNWQFKQNLYLGLIDKLTK